MNALAAQPAAPAQHGRFLRMPDVVAQTGLSAATINRLYRRGQFPPKFHLSLQSVGWWESDIEAWKAARRPVTPAGRAAPPAPG